MAGVKYINNLSKALMPEKNLKYNEMYLHITVIIKVFGIMILFGPPE